jgi:formiminoglutamase
MEHVATTLDPRWPSAASLLRATPSPDRRNVGLVGLSTYATSLSPRSSLSTPSAVRAALERYSTWSYSDHVDLAEVVNVVDCGDVTDPDGEGGRERTGVALAAFGDQLALRIVLGGDNAATWHALSTLAGADLAHYGLITLDAHLDLRDGQSNGSPVRQLLEAGLNGHHVVQVGLADFSNAPFYAQRALDAGVTVISRHELRTASIEQAVARALAVAGADGRPVYVDVDMDAADRSVVPGCPAAAPGGFSADEMRRFVRAVTADPRVSALDITEIDVDRDSDDQRTIRLAALLVLEALAGVQRRPL